MDRFSNFNPKDRIFLTDVLAISEPGKDSIPEKVTVAGLAASMGVGPTQQIMGSAANGNPDDPRGTITPVNPNAFAMYIKDQQSPVVLWYWSITGQTWFNVLS